MKPETRYINTDLDIFSRDDLSPIAKLIENKCCVLQCGWRENDVFHLCLESDTDTEDPRTIDDDISALLDVMENLPRDRLEEIKNSCKIDFNVGVDTGLCWGKNFGVTNDNLKRIVNMGGTISFTMYPSDALKEA